VVRVFYFCNMIDFLIVGGGLAGISFAEAAYVNHKSFKVITDASHNSSLVAAGLYNPVILKRFSLPADAALHLDFITTFYKRIEERLEIKVNFKLPVYRRFASVEEQNDWFATADKPALERFLSTNIVHHNYAGLTSPYGFGVVKETGYIDTAGLIKGYHRFLWDIDALLVDTFQHSAVIIADDHVSYKDIKAKHIVFAEGFGIHSNPYFNYLPLEGTKGEILVIKAPELRLDVAVNAGVFILPIGDDLFKVGATYEWYDKTAAPTAAGKQELLEKLDEIISCKYEVVDHMAGIRPTTKDRKVLMGTHPKYDRLHLLNGLGTRGVMLGPPMAHELLRSINDSKPVQKDLNLSRFYKLYRDPDISISGII